ncbi:MAG: flagellar motor switch protein FliM [Tissierella sp.]|nr:flagellar motor switch protein FliM [Tissierella sp.]
MKQVLSQQEIDSLLAALDTGEIDSETVLEEKEVDKVKSYDFRRPIKLSKEYINTLYMIFENFSKIAGNLLSSQIRSNAKIALGGVEQISYDEFLRSIPRSTLLGMFRSKPLTGIQLLEINPQFCMQAIDLMCGGFEKTTIDMPADKERFTDIELGILEEIVISILRSFEAAWAEIIEIETELDSLETNPQLIQNMSPNEPVILISFIVDVLDNRSFMNICIPYVSFENVIDKLSMKNWFDFDKEINENSQEILKERIMSSVANLEVVLGKSIITVDDFLHLEAGDILQLDLKTTDPLKMYVEDKLHYLVRPGEINSRLAVQVLQYIEEDVE